MDTKSLKKKLAIVLAMVGVLAMAVLAQAQDVYYWINFYPPFNTTSFPGSALYASWADYPNNPSEVNFGAVFNGDLPTSGIEVTSTVGGYGSCYASLNGGTGVTFDNGNTALSTNDTLCLLSFTVNPTPTMAAGSLFYTNYNWMGIQYIFNFDSGIYSFPVPYGGWNNPGNSNAITWSGSNVTVTVNLASLSRFATYTVGGTNHFYGLNLGFNPAVIHNDTTNSGGLSYDITFNAITFEPAPPTPPNLSVSYANPNVVISWPDPNTNAYTLYQSANMAQFSWAPWGFAPVWNNGTNTVAIPPPFNQELFFRLSNSSQ